MPDFNKKGTFNQDANFQGVKFGADAPLLETELNELQDIQTEARADIIRDSIPSGFTQLGDIDYSYMLNNENCVKIKSESIAYVNGYKIRIPRDTIIDVGIPPEREAREDLIFLEVWKEEVTKDSNLTLTGGEGQASIPNNILDPRVGQETSRRVALKWRIRHVANIDFDTYKSNGFVKGDISYNGADINKTITTQGGNSSPLSWVNHNFSGFVKANLTTISAYSKGININDNGLYISGNGDGSKNMLKTYDGYVYAIPMFRLFRKASCGKAKPFEYQKLNPKVDYSKISKIVNGENVERIESIALEGRTLLNLATVKSGSFTFKPDANPSNGFGINLVQNTKQDVNYTLILNVKKNTLDKGIKLALYDSTGTPAYPGAFETGVNGIVTRVIRSSNQQLKSLRLYTDNTSAGEVIIDDIMVLEGDWTNLKLPKYFYGLKSLGEDDNNLIEIRNSILDDSSYDPYKGNAKLLAFPKFTTLTPVDLVEPKIQAQLKRGESKLSDITKFDVLTNLVGDETIEFTKVSGNTLHNLLNKPLYEGIKYYDDQENFKATVVNDYHVIEVLNDCDVLYDLTTSDLDLVKPNTQYTFIVEVKENTCSGAFRCNTNLKYVFTNGGVQSYIGFSEAKTCGLFKYTYTSEPNPTINNIPIKIAGCKAGEILKYKLVILEGNKTELDIPYFKGIKSVGENDNKVRLVANSNNLFNPNNYTECGGSGLATSSEAFIKPTTIGDTRHRWICVKLPINKTYTVTLDKRRTTPNGWSTVIIESDCDSIVANAIYYKLHLGVHDTSKVSVHTFTTTKPYVFIHVGHGTGWEEYKSDIFNSLRIELGDTQTTYEPYKEYLKTLTLKQPLRGLPNGVCDTIEGSKVIRRIKKVVFNGSEDWRINSSESTDTSRFILSLEDAKPNAGIRDDNLICDSFAIENGFSTNRESCFINNVGTFSIYIKNSKLVQTNIQQFKTWLSNNPVVLFYELSAPIIEPIEPNYDKESLITYQLDAPLRSLPNGIKDTIINEKLTRGCGQLLLNGTENWATVPTNDNDDTLLFQLPINGSKASSNDLVCCQSTVLVQTANKVWSTLNTNHCISLNIYGNIHFRCSKALLGSGVDNLQKFKSYLKDNPVPVIYQLSKTIEKSIRESNFNEMNFDKQRLFKSGSWLREIPNGAKDEVNFNKVIRRTKAITFTGIEEWVLHNEGVNNDTLAFHTSVVTDKKPNTVMLSDKFDYAHSTLIPTTDRELISGQLETSIIYIRVLKSKLETPDANGFKKWLSVNPVKVLYELQTPTEEALTASNNMYPPHHTFNSYCGCLYVGNGTNNTFVNNTLPIDSVKVSSSFREFIDRSEITDCRYRKNKDGYNFNVLGSSNKNKFLKDIERGSVDIDSNTGNLLIDSTNYILRTGMMFLKGDSNTFVLSCNLSGRESNLVAGTYLVTFNSEGKHLRKVDLLLNKPFSLNKGEYFGRLRMRTSDSSAYSDSEIELIRENLQLECGSVPSSYVSPNVHLGHFLSTIEKDDVEDLRSLVSLTGFNYDQLLNSSFDKLLKGDL